MARTLAINGSKRRVRLNIVLRGATGDMVVVGRTVVSNGGKSVDDSTSRQRGEGDKSAFDILYIFMYNAALA